MLAPGKRLQQRLVKLWTLAILVVTRKHCVANNLYQGLQERNSNWRQAGKRRMAGVTTGFLKNARPFTADDRRKRLEFVAERSQMAFTPQGTEIVGPGDGPVAYFTSSSQAGAGRQAGEVTVTDIPSSPSAPGASPSAQ